MYLKLLIQSCIIAGTFLLLAGCSLTDPPYHELRLKNNYDKTIVRLVVGTIAFTDVAPGETTEYHEFPEGEHTFHGTLSDATIIKGSWEFTGRGFNYWTAILAPSGTFTFIHE